LLIKVSNAVFGLLLARPWGRVRVREQLGPRGLQMANQNEEIDWQEQKEMRPQVIEAIHLKEEIDINCIQKMIEDEIQVDCHEPKVSGSPEEIWLVYGIIDNDDTHLNLYKNVEVTWCSKQVYPSDVKYVRADLVKEMK
jgi:mannitol/fructose-specific phosphotransferase system IIA component